MRKKLDALYKSSGWLAGAFMVLITCLMLVMAFGRKLGINIPDGDYFVGWSLTAMAFLGLAHTFKAGDMIRMGLLRDRLRGKSKWALEITCLLVAVAFLGYFLWHAIALNYESWLVNEPSQGALPIPIWIPQLGMTLGLLLLFVAFVDEFLLVLQGRDPSYDKAAPATPEGITERAIQNVG